MNLIDSKINEISILLVVLNRFWATTSFWNCSSNHHITSSWTSPDRLKNQWNLSPFSCLEKVLKPYCFRNCISNHCISEIISNLVFLIHTLTLVAVLWIRFILIRIRIRGSVSDDYGSGSDSWSRSEVTLTLWILFSLLNVLQGYNSYKV